MNLSFDRAALSIMALLTQACSVPDLRIEERASVRGARDAAAPATDGGGSEQLDAGSSDDQPARDSGADVSTGRAGTAAPSGGRSGNAAMSGEGGADAAGNAASGGRAGTPASAAGAGGAAGTAQPMQPARACLVWTSINIRNGPPPGAIEGGFETVAGVTTRQFICRIRPAGSTYAIPGKYVDRLGCYIARRHDAQVMDVSVLDGLIDVLVPAPGCTFSWRAASPGEIPAGAVDLGDPADGRNYGCRGEYSNLGASGTQIGTIIPSTDAPPVNQCWFESFGGTIQPTEPAEFEVLVLDPL
jgi:hypothetical protein